MVIVTTKYHFYSENNNNSNTAKMWGVFVKKLTPIKILIFFFDPAVVAVFVLEEGKDNKRYTEVEHTKIHHTHAHHTYGVTLHEGTRSLMNRAATSALKLPTSLGLFFFVAKGDWLE